MKCDTCGIEFPDRCCLEAAQQDHDLFEDCNGTVTES